jgi:hypothetical protein
MKHPNTPRSLLSALAVAAMALIPSAKATPPGHDIAAGLFIVQTLDLGDTTNSVIVTMPYSINDYRARTNSNRADYNVQVGPDATVNPANGVLMSTPYGNGYDYSAFGGGISNCISACDFNSGGWWIPTFGVMNQASGSNPELNVSVAGAYFPFSTWIGGYVKNSGNTNGGTMNVLTGNSKLTLDTNDSTKGYYIDLGGGRSTIDLRNLGYDCRASDAQGGILLATGCKNESANYGSTGTNFDGTWATYVHDNGQNNAGFEQDPIAFVFIPKTNTTVISGRFDGAGNILAFSGNTPQFTVTSVSTGQWELKPIGKSAVNGVLIVSPEVVTNSVDADNFVSYAINANQDGWIIQSHDCPVGGLEAVPAGVPVCSFVFIPGGTPGVTVTPTNNIFTSESGGTATFTVKLDAQPTADVTIPVSSGNASEGVTDVSSLTFTADNWAQPQTVTVTGVDDSNSDGTVFYNVNLGPASSADGNYNGRQVASVTVGNADNDPGVTVIPTSGLFTSESGGTATFNVHLNTQPTDTVTISLSSSNPNEGTVSVSQLVFDSGNWNVDQVVTVTGVDDNVVDGDVAYTIITGTAVSNDPTYNGYNPADVALINRDNDNAGLVVSAAGAEGLTIIEGRGTNYNVNLSTPPSQNVTVNIASSDTQGGTVSPSSLLFTPANWNVPQTVNVNATDDLAIDGTTAWFITNSVSTSDPTYSHVAAVPVVMYTLDNEPTVTVASDTVIYGTGIGSLGIASRATVSDPNTSVFTGTTLTVAITNNAAGNDQLSVRNDGNAAGQIGVSGNNISYGGTQIASFSPATGSTPMVITFNAAATATSIEATLRNVTFQNPLSSPSLATRSVSIVLRHADGGQSSVSKSIRVGLLRATEFQEGADHGYGVYSGENDILLREANPNTAYPAGNNNSGLFIDWPDPGSQNSSEALMRFDNIFGNGPGQIPSNAVIVGAWLTFNVYDSGDGSPLYRINRDWDATNMTWSSFGAGLTIGTDTQGTAYSVWGLPDGSGNTTTGPATFSVLPDLQAWGAGEANHGWVMPGWNGNLDGTGVSPSEDPIVSNRPNLRVLWLPPTVSSNSFRQGVNNYSNAVDTQIRGSDPATAFNASTTIGVDWTVTNPGDQSQVLLRFDNIFGTGPNQIPLGSQIHAAVLDLTSQSGSAQGHGGAFHMMLTSWNDTDTWTTFGQGIAADNSQAASVLSAQAGNSNLTEFAQGGYLSYELTSDVAQWASGAKANYGWVIMPWVNGGDGWFFSTAENGNVSYRPQLRVFYTPGALPPPTLKIGTISRSSGTVTINFSGAPSTTYNIVRATTVKGTYGSAGTATTDGSGNGTFTDNAAPAGSAFYQISQ